MGIAEFIIGPAECRTQWPRPILRVDLPLDGQISLINSHRIISLVRPSKAPNRVRLKTNFVSGFKLIFQSWRQKILLSENQKLWYLPHVSLL